MKKYKNLLKLVTLSTLTFAMEREDIQTNIATNKNKNKKILSLEEMNENLVYKYLFSILNYTENYTKLTFQRILSMKKEKKINIEEINKELIVYTKFEDKNDCYHNFFTKNFMTVAREREYNFMIEFFELHVLRKYLDKRVKRPSNRTMHNTCQKVELEKLPFHQIGGALLYTALISESDVKERKIKFSITGDGEKLEKTIEVSLEKMMNYIKLNKNKIFSNHFKSYFINLKELHLKNIVILRSNILSVIDIDNLELIKMTCNFFGTKKKITYENGKKQLIEERKVPNIPYNQELMHFIKKLRSPNLIIEYYNLDAQSCINDTPIRRGNLKKLEYHLDRKEIKHKNYSSMMMLTTEPTINHSANQEDKRNACIVEIYNGFSHINLKEVQSNFEAFKKQQQAFRE